MNRFPALPPASVAPSPWAFPEMVKRQPSTRIEVAVVRMPALPIVKVRWCFLSGGMFEDSDRLGSAVLLQRLLRHGTVEQDAVRFARQLDREGIRLGTQVSADSMIVSVSALRDHFSQALQIANDVAFRPRLSKAALAMERIRTVHTHQQAGVQVESVSNLWMAHAIYGDHPYGRPVTTLSGLKETTVDDVTLLHRRIVDSSRALLLVVGDVRPHDVIDQVARRVANVAVPDQQADPAPPPIAPNSGGVWLVEKPGAEQVSIGVGLLAMRRNDPDFLALRAVNQIIGGGASSRLFTRLRDQEALTYGAYSRLDSGRWAGDLTASVTVSPNKLGRALQSLSMEMRRASSGDFSSNERERALNYLVGSFPQKACGLSGVSLLTTAAWMHDLPSSVWRDYQRNLSSLSIDDLVAVSRKWIRPQELCWVIAGSPEALASAKVEISELHGRIQRVEMGSLTD